MTPRITIETTTGAIAPKLAGEQTLADVLAVRRLPANLFQAYVTDGLKQPRPIPNDTRLEDLEHVHEVELRCIMNPNFGEFLELVLTRHTTPNAVTTVEELNFGRDGCEKTVHEIDDAAARRIVAERVGAFVADQSREPTVLAGVSGGGDSNALIASLQAALATDGRRLLAYTLVCEPVWPETSAARAAELCCAHGVEHLVIDGPGMESLLEMRSSVPVFLEAFLDRFGHDTSHFFATYMISLAGRRLCRARGLREYCLGYNREDVFAELLFSVINGRKPLPYPVRRFGDVDLLMPVWEIPKLVLDACYPSFSRRNYEQRITTTPQRGLIYFLAHAIEGVYVNLGLSLMTGLRQVFEPDWPELVEYADFDVYTEPWVPPADAEEVRGFLSQFFRARGEESSDGAGASVRHRHRARDARSRRAVFV
jgi:hypothetical protein